MLLCPFTCVWMQLPPPLRPTPRCVGTCRWWPRTAARGRPPTATCSAVCAAVTAAANNTPPACKQHAAGLLTPPVPRPLSPTGVTHKGLRQVLAAVEVRNACHGRSRAARRGQRAPPSSSSEHHPARSVPSQARDPHQPEFLAAVKEVAVALQPVFEKRPEMLPVFGMMCEPERAIVFRVPWCGCFVLGFTFWVC